MFFKDNEVSVKYIRIITNPERQWAAVRIHWGLINEPPQNQVSFKLNPTSQGNSVGPAWIPPTIRVSSLLALPQISKKTRVNLTSYFQIVISLEKFVKLHHSYAK